MLRLRQLECHYCLHFTQPHKKSLIHRIMWLMVLFFFSLLTEQNRRVRLFITAHLYHKKLQHVL